MKYRILFILLISSLLLACKGKEETASQADRSQHDHSQHKHKHELLEITDFGGSILIPTIEATASADAMEGWNIRIKTSNFAFTPEKVNLENTANEGHAHLYVDGYKFSRIYSTWYHLKKLTPGKHTLRITLNSNDHSLMGYQGQEISATIIVEQK